MRDPGTQLAEARRGPRVARLRLRAQLGEDCRDIAKRLYTDRKDAVIERCPVDAQHRQRFGPGVEPGVAQLDRIEPDQHDAIGLLDEREVFRIHHRRQPDAAKA